MADDHADEAALFSGVFILCVLKGCVGVPIVPQSSSGNRRAAEILTSPKPAGGGKSGGEPSGSLTKVTSFCPVYNCYFYEHNCHYLMEAPNKRMSLEFGHSTLLLLSAAAAAASEGSSRQGRR